LTAMSVMQEGFERCAADMVGERRPVSGHRGQQPSIAAQFIYEYALELVDWQGIEALTMRRLAAELKISTRTLYKRIGSRADMIDELVGLYSSRLHLDFQPHGAWEDSIWAWCLQLHQALTARPHLILMAQGRTPVEFGSHVKALVDAIAAQSVPHGVAVETCWSLADLMVTDAMGAVREMTSGDASAAVWSSVQPSQCTADAIKWILRGVGAASGSSTGAGDGL
jgi:AcrR family transcriptional regulator